MAIYRNKRLRGCNPGIILVNNFFVAYLKDNLKLICVAYLKDIL